MTNFYYDEEFYEDLHDLAKRFDVYNTEDLNELEDDWSVEIELTNLEPVFEINSDILCELLCEKNEERLGEDEATTEDTIGEITKALNECIDFEKLKQLLPQFCYPNCVFKTITKADLVCYFED
jgi:hypothetical protein